MVKEHKKTKSKAPKVVMEYDNDDDIVFVKKDSKAKEKVKKPTEKKVVKKKKKVTKKEPKEKVVKTSKKKEREEKLKKRIEAPVDETIQRLLDSGRTFVDNITKNAKKSIFSSFYPFPKNVSFLSTEKDEAVVLMVRHHWTGLMKSLFLALFALMFPFLLVTVTEIWVEGFFSVALFNIGLFIFFGMVFVTILLDSFYKWFFEMNIITTSRIIDMDFVSITSHRVSETTFEQVQDVSHSPAGPLASFFDYGHLYIQTAGAKNEFTFDNIPRPRDVQDAIWDLRYLRRKKLGLIK